MTLHLQSKVIFNIQNPIFYDVVNKESGGRHRHGWGEDRHGGGIRRMWRRNGGGTDTKSGTDVEEVDWTRNSLVRGKAT